jgi:hypothetical protein
MRRGRDHKWAFVPRFRRHVFGWKSRPAVQRVQEAVREIKTVARSDSLLAAEGAVVFLERVSPAIEQVDGSSGAIGAAVNRAIAALVPIIAGAAADTPTRARWLERLFEAHAADEMPYIEQLADHWGELCACKEVASEWADRLLEVTRMAFSPDPNLRGHFHDASACLSALYKAGRYPEIIDLVAGKVIWPYKSWAVKGLAAMGRRAAAIRYAESCRSPWATDHEIDALCEGILLSSGLADEAYARYGLRANRTGTYLATFNAVQKKYPRKRPADILADLVATTAGEEGKWFAAAKDAELYEEALALARHTPCDPKTLTRAARDHAEVLPVFAVEAGMLALHWLVQGYGYEIRGADVWAAYTCTMKAAERQGSAAETRKLIRELVASEATDDRFVTKVLGRELGLE